MTGAGRNVAVAVLLTLVVAAGPAVAAARKAPPTLKDLKNRPVEIRAGETVTPDPDKARDLYRKFIGLDAGDPVLRLEALRRLADLELESGDAERGEALAQGAGTSSTREAIALYGRLLEQAPDYPRADAVLYQLSRGWEAEGEPAKALEYLDQLVARFPQSRYIDEAQFRRGEILFSAQRWREAERAYGAVIAQGPSSAFRSQAFYKRGWAQFKLSDMEGSAASMLAVLDRELVDPANPAAARELEALPRAQRELVEDSLRALVIQFAGLEGVSDAEKALAAHGPAPYEWLLYASLGDLYLDKERWTDAADAYRAFVHRAARDERAPTLQTRAIAAYLKGGFVDQALDGKREYVEHYAFAGPWWQGREREAYPAVVADLKVNLKDVARHHHAVAQASKKRDDYQQAARWYRDYLASFPTDPDSVDTNYLLAECLFESGQYRDAAIEYERTAYDYPQGPRSAQAGYASLVARDKHEAGLAGADKAEWQRAGIDSSLRFVQTFPAHPESGPVQLRAMLLLHALRDYPRAADVAGQLLVRMPPMDAQAERQALGVLGDARFELGEFEAAEKAYTELRGRLPPGDKQAASIDERLAASVYKQGEQRQAGGDKAGAVADFLRVASVAPTAGIRANAQFDAAALLLEMQDWPRAIGVLEGFRRDYPDNPLTATIPRRLAGAYEASGQKVAAAVEYERIANAPAEPAEARRQALEQAADLYEQGGDAARAAGTLETFVTRYPEPVVAAIEARQRLADFAGKRGASADRARWLKDIVAADATAGAARTDRTRYLAALATLEMAAPARDAFRAAPLNAPLKKSLAAKRQALEKALAAYKAAAAYGVREATTAANYETAELYRQLATDLIKSERPKGLKGDELEQYDLLLEEQAYPFEEQAIDLHVTNAARAREGVYDRWVQASYAALAGLKPARYGKSELEPTATGGATLELGITQAKAGDYAAAEASLRQAVIDTPPGSLALNQLGVLYRRTGRFHEAEEAYRSALAADPAFAPACLNLGVLLDLYLEQPEAALEQYERYLALVGAPDAEVTKWVREVRTRVPQPAVAAPGPEAAPAADPANPAPQGAIVTEVQQ